MTIDRRPLELCDLLLSRRAHQLQLDSLRVGPRTLHGTRMVCHRMRRVPFSLAQLDQPPVRGADAPRAGMATQMLGHGEETQSRRLVPGREHAPQQALLRPLGEDDPIGRPTLHRLLDHSRPAVQAGARPRDALVLHRASHTEHAEAVPLPVG